MINVILQFLGLDLFNIKLSAKSYQNIPNGLRVNFHFFQNLNLGKTSTNPKCHFDNLMGYILSISNVYAKFHHNIPLSSRDRAIFTFSEFGAVMNRDTIVHFILIYFNVGLLIGHSLHQVLSKMIIDHYTF